MKDRTPLPHGAPPAEKETAQAAAALLDALAQGRRSGEQAGWLTEAQIRAHFRAKADAVGARPCGCLCRPRTVILFGEKRKEH